MSALEIAQRFTHGSSDFSIEQPKPDASAFRLIFDTLYFDLFA